MGAAHEKTRKSRKPSPQREETHSSECRPGRPLHPKLFVGSVDDPCEALADELADRVLRMTDSTNDLGASAAVEKPLQQIRRKPDLRNSFETPPIVDEVLASGGRPLPEDVRAYMEPRFGHRFSDVSIHTDERAADSAAGIHARAYAVGNDIVFGAGQFDPGTSSGKWLIAHELAHIVQGAAPALAARAFFMPPPPPAIFGPAVPGQDDRENRIDKFVPAADHPVKAGTKRLTAEEVSEIKSNATDIVSELKTMFPDYGKIHDVVYSAYTQDNADIREGVFPPDASPRVDLLCRTLEQSTWEKGLIVKEQTNGLNEMVLRLKNTPFDVKPILASSRVFSGFTPVEERSLLTSTIVDLPLAATGVVSGIAKETLPFIGEKISGMLDSTAQEYAKVTGGDIDVHESERTIGRGIGFVAPFGAAAKINAAVKAAEAAEALEASADAVKAAGAGSNESGLLNKAAEWIVDHKKTVVGAKVAFDSANVTKSALEAKQRIDELRRQGKPPGEIAGDVEVMRKLVEAIDAATGGVADLTETNKGIQLIIKTIQISDYDTVKIASIAGQLNELSDKQDDESAKRRHELEWEMAKTIVETGLHAVDFGRTASEDSDAHSAQ